MQAKPLAGDFNVSLTNVRLNQTAHYFPGMLPDTHASKALSPIYMGRTTGIVTGGVVFLDCVVADDRNRSFLSTGHSATHRARGGLEDVQGSFTVHNPFGCTVALGPRTVDVHLTTSSCLKTDDTSSWSGAMLRGRNATSAALHTGLADRLRFEFEHVPKWHQWDLTALAIHAAALSAPLPAAALNNVSKALNATLADFDMAPALTRIFDTTTLDGVHAYQPTITPPPPPPLGPCLDCHAGLADGRGFKIEDLGVPGACASVWRAPEETLLDCQMVHAWRPSPKNDDDSRCISVAMRVSSLMNQQGHQECVNLKTDESSQKLPRSCQQLPLAALPYCNSTLTMDERADDLLARLTTTELVSQMQGTTPAAIPRLGLAEATFGGEALHGVVAKCINASGVRRCPTQFPAPLALGATFSKKLFQAVGAAISVEARALYNFGCPTCPPGKKAWGVEGDLWLAFYAPNINLLRDSRWGRVAEVVSEDVLTTMTFAREFTAGMLGEGEPGHASKYWRTLPICKHFAAYSLDVDVDPTDATFGWTRSNISQNVTRRDLAESYLPAFEGCIRKNQPGGPGVMCALNAHSIDGHPSVPSCASRELLNNTLYGSMGFTSFVAGDCNAVQQIGVGYGGAKAVHPDSHQYAVDAAAAIQDALAAPVTSDCGEAYRRGLATLVANGSVPASQLRPLVRRLLLSRLRLGTLDSPADVPYQKLGAENVESTKHTALSRIAARSAVVILKNTGDLLPLVPTRLTSIALVGPIVNATDLFLGPYAESSPSSPQSILTTIQSASAFSKHVRWSPGCAVNGRPDGSRIDAAVAAAIDADIAVVGLGLCGHTDAVCNGTLNEGEGSDRASLALPGQQVKLLRAIVSSRHAKGLPTVLVVSSGGAVDLAEFVADEGVTAILWSAPGGKWGGSAFVDVMLSTGEPLDGVAVGGGRMPYTIFPTGYVEALPYADLDMRRGGGRTYRFSAAPKVFEFGSGLNVMNFSVSCELESDTITTNETAAVRVSVTNHGWRKATASMATNACGAFSVLGFVSPVGGDSSFVKQLFDFSRLDCVVVGSTVNLTLQVTPWARSEVDMTGRRVSKPGEFRVTIADAESNRPVSLKVLGPSTTLTDYFGNGSGSVKHKTDDDPARPEHELWVDATSGSDHADGSKASPLRSLATAAARMRQLKAAGGTCIVHVAATGTYAPLHLDANDSNTAWRCHGGSLCEVSAGAQPGNISAHWTTSTDPRLPTVARGSVLEITLDPAQAALLAPSTANHGGPGGGHMPTEPHTSLYFKGKAMQLARYPNLGLSAFQTGPATNWTIVPSTGVGECLNWTDDRPTRWAAAAARGDLQLHGMFFVQWKDSYVYNVSVDLQKRQLCHEGGYPVYGVAKGGVYYAFNLLEELDRPGEFVMDARARKLLFWPPTSFDPTKVLLSNATSILSLANGTANVSVQGFAFRHSRGAGVAAIGPERFELDHCEVTDTGGEGVSIGAEPGTDVRYSEPLGGSHRVTNSTISRTGLAGVVVSCGRRRTLEACNALVSDNHISNFARWGLTYQPGIALAGVGVVVEHNRIERGPHLGLSAAGNDHVFSRNVISDVCLETRVLPAKDDTDAICMECQAELNQTAAADRDATWNATARMLQWCSMPLRADFPHDLMRVNAVGTMLVSSGGPCLLPPLMLPALKIDDRSADTNLTFSSKSDGDSGLGKIACPFCPHQKRAKVLGAADTGLFPGPAAGFGGAPDVNRTFAAMIAAGQSVLDYEISGCSSWQRLGQLLDAAAAFGVQVVAGFETDCGRAPDAFCGNFRRAADGLVDWPSLAGQVANLSLLHHNLIGYRLDDFTGCCRQQMHGNKSVLGSHWTPQDASNMQHAAKALNPRLKFYPVFYMGPDNAVNSPYSYSMGMEWSDAHPGGILTKGATITLRVDLHVSFVGDSILEFFELTDFPHDSWQYGLVDRTLRINGENVLHHDLANITTSEDPTLPHHGRMAGPLDPRAAGGWTLPVKIQRGLNTLEWELKGRAPAAAWKLPRKITLHVWDILLQPLESAVPAQVLVGNESWSVVSIHNATAPGTMGEIFGGSNRNWSVLPATDGVLATWAQFDALWQLPQQQLLYQRLLASTRRALAGPDQVQGRHYQVLATHFGMVNWKGFDAAVESANNAPIKPHYGVRVSRAGIIPEHLYQMMMVDAFMADGIFIWWDLPGIAADARAGTGIFSQPHSERANELRLRMWTLDEVGLLKGWTQQWTTTVESAQNLSLSFMAEDSTGLTGLATTSFRFRLQLQQTNGTWMEVFGQDSATTFQCNASSICLRATSQTCTVSCLSSRKTQISLILAAPTQVRVQLATLHDEDATIDLRINSSLEHSAWTFSSGIDPKEASSLQVAAAITNATQTILTCQCKDNSATASAAVLKLWP